MSAGIVSSVRTSPTADGEMHLIQTTAPISHGNSGSPLMNKNGEVLGIITFSYNDSQNINFAIDISNVYFYFPAIQYSMPLDKNARAVEEDDYEKELRETGSFAIKDRVSAFVGQDREIIKSQFKDWRMIKNTSDLLAFSDSEAGVYNYYFNETPSICDGESYTIEKGISTNEFIQMLFANGYKRANGETGNEETQSFFTHYFVIKVGPENSYSTKNLVFCTFNPNYHVKRKK